MNSLSALLNDSKTTIIITGIPFHRVVAALVDNSQINNYKLKTKEDVIEELLGTIRPSALFDVGQVISPYPLAAEMIKKFRYQQVSAEKLLSDEVFQLVTLKKNWTHFPQFIKRYQQSQVVFINTSPDAILDKCLKNLQIDHTLFYLPPVKQQVRITEYPTSHHEIEAIVNDIALFLSKGEDIKQLCIYLGTAGYRSYLQLLLDKSRIAVHGRYYPLINFTLTKKLMNYLQTKTIITSTTFKEFFENVKETYDENALRCLLDAVNKVGAVVLNQPADLALPFLDYWFTVSKYSPSVSDNPLMITTDIETAATYKQVYLVGANENLLRWRNDDPLFSDKQRLKADMITTLEENMQEEQKYIKLLKQVPHLNISYALVDNNETQMLSPLIASLYEEIPISSHQIKLSEEGVLRYYLFANAMQSVEEYVNYNIDDKHLPYYLGLFPSLQRYRDYNNDCRDLSKETTKILLKDRPVSLSPTTLESYIKCPFFYLADRLLNLRSKTFEPAAEFGILIHNLMQGAMDNENIPALINRLTNQYYQRFDLVIKEKYEDSFKKLLNQYVSTFVPLLSQAGMKPVALERKFVINKNGAVFTGIIDNLSSADIEDTKQYFIFDYKTGKFNLPSLQTVKDGYYLQLPSYLYLLSQQYPIAELGGLFFLNLSKKRDEDEALGAGVVSQTSADKTKLDLKIGSVLSLDELEQYQHFVEGWISDSAEKISSGHFPIVATSVENKLNCQYCPYWRICQQDSNDYIEIGASDGLD